MTAALLLIDIQNDFLPGGALAVPEGDQVIEPANRLARHFDLVFATQDWHPADHGSFAANHPDAQVGQQIQLNGGPQILWPVHCVQGTTGAQFAPSLQRDAWTAICPKGEDPGVDSYSGFYDNAKQRKTGLDELLKRSGVESLYIAGLATEYCVKFTVLDALQLGYRTYLVQDACRGLDEHAVAAAIGEMRRAGAEIVSCRQVLDSVES